MIDFQEFMLANGLRVIIHKTPECAMAALNVMYNVGSRDEDESRTGLAHLFEHLMFGGSENIPSYDTELQRAGGTNNAYTTSDVTNYHCMLPSYNIETAFWLESDRMLNLAFNESHFEVEKKVVVEEFKERCLNKPYGNAWHKLRELAYTKHPYNWPVLGKNLAHIEGTRMEEVKQFFYKFYKPNNAVLVVSGGIDEDEVKELCEKWFGPIKAGAIMNKDFPQEPAQVAPRNIELQAKVPFDAIYKAYHIPGRLSPEYYALEILSAILSEGNSSKLYETLVNDKKIFNSINAYTSQSVDPGLLVISGTVSKKISLEQAEQELDSLIESVLNVGISERELDKAKNNYVSSTTFASMDLLARSEELAFATILGNTNMVNEDLEKMDGVSSSYVYRVAMEVLRPENCSTLFYKKESRT